MVLPTDFTTGDPALMPLEKALDARLGATKMMTGLASLKCHH
ncbi:MAG: hypothetical protein ACRELY_16045 [Polyangiaceae bacterium]